MTTAKGFKECRKLQIALRLDPKIFAEVERLAKIDDRSFSWMVSNLVKEALAARKVAA